MTSTETLEPAITPATNLLHRRLVLTGFMGAGKSTIGRLLASRFGWNFVDLDTHLESRAHATVPELFARHGEDHFRRLESTALASALAMHHIVLALGGGTPEQLTNRLLLEQTPGTYTIFLDAPFATLYDRCLLQATDRPVLADPDRARERFDLRRPHYLRLAHHVVDTTVLTPEQSIDAICAHLTQTPHFRR